MPYLPYTEVPGGRKALTGDHYTPGYGKAPGEGVVLRAPEADRPGLRVHREAGQVVRSAAVRRGADPARARGGGGAPGTWLGLRADRHHGRPARRPDRAQPAVQRSHDER